MDMSLLAIAHILYLVGMKERFLKSVVKHNSPDNALILVKNFVHQSKEYTTWLYQYIDTDSEIANFRLLNDDRANKIVSKRVLTKMRNDIFANKDENKVSA